MFKIEKKTIENLFTTCVITVFMGQIYINPYSQWFRFSVAVIALAVLLIFFEDIPIIFTTTIIAIFMFLFRASVHFIAYHDTTFYNTLINYTPVAIFYVVYGFCFKVLNIRKKLNKPLAVILCLWICDSMGNIAEGAFRQITTDFLFGRFDKAVVVIILIGLFRSIITYLAYFLSLYYKNRYDREQKENKYKELLLFIAKLKTELFFLRKSIHDIEDTMNKSYTLYEELNEFYLQDKALDIARNIHEIKKDYLRVVTGMEKTLSDEKQNMLMSIKDVVNIINGNTKKLLHIHKKDISLKFTIKDIFYTNDYYSLISILNNLIINSIEAMESAGEIIVEEELYRDNYIFRVIDNGVGFEDDDIDTLFEPGYSTKYDPKTGEMSTGIGLSHVKQIVETYYEGSITAKSNKNNTTFEITIPCEKIEIGK